MATYVYTCKCGHLRSNHFPGGVCLEFGCACPEFQHRITRYSTTEYNRSQRVISRLQSIYSAARSFHSSHSQILETLDRDIYSGPDFKKLTPYYRGYFAGIHQALRDELYRYHLEWRVFFRGHLVKSKEVPEGAWSEVEGDKGQHVWSDAPEKLFSSPEVK